eukprot:1307809-Ditylum_brightwellii.AAC.1
MDIDSDNENEHTGGTLNEENHNSMQHDFSKLETKIVHNSKIHCRHGNNLDLAVNDYVFHLYFQNFNGISLNDESEEFLDETTILKELGSSLVSG